MALFSASESVYLSSFLSSVDLDSSINNDGSIDPGLAEQIPHLQGSEALAKATKDLMSLDVPVTTSSSSHNAGQGSNSQQSHQTSSSPPSYWPSLPPSEQPSSSAGSTQHHPKYAQGVRSSSPAHYLPRGLSGTIAPSDSLRSATPSDRANTSIFTSHLGQQQQQQQQHPQQHVQIAPLRGFEPSTSSSSAGYTLPPISTSGYPNGLSSHESSRPPAIPSAASAPSVLTHQYSGASTSTSTKRPLPASSEPATDPSSSKRARPSLSSSTYPPAPELSSADSATTTGSGAGPGPAASSRPRPSSSGTQRAASSAGADGSAKSKGKEKEKDKDKDKEKDKGGASGSKGALLSPSQKRANHIQSEQKRRANIRRGYEALCEVVPALREAIRAEEERERAGAGAGDGGDDGSGGKAKARGVGGGGAGGDKGKKKRKGEGEKADGRAGPRSENVVLQKTIDYITELLDDRAALAQRLQIARGILPLGHPAAQLDPRHLDPQGVPLWDREWNGGMDLDVGAQDEGSEDEG
ncbi:hypothetical protein C8Q73DRAFT_785517 [Cubamyces lactineus]|nr:hypothetical protein C8Q73DRAFT_785517 [Cubamyces lactineus]